eukprot:CAMPEP_0117651752 /NCGR_PEP_ID=MMETSP0804-20121206/2261_1 /TAXON_ID=1074897 /ORGANISM="Tetraselmis astigmatica, Strain CCMP880" /LENGTH=957 /DNA_ID=CAMNT_0005457753 /DNA_START=126 /DNA_END=2999 /DNA_ORIENTATION=-
MSSRRVSMGEAPSEEAVVVGGKEMGPKWSPEEIRKFFHAYHAHGQEWEAISGAVGSRSPANCEAVFRLTQSFLSISRHFQNEEALVAVVTDHYENLISQEASKVASVDSLFPPGSASRRVSIGRSVTYGPAGEEPGAAFEQPEPPASLQPPSHGLQVPTKGRRTTPRRPRASYKAQAQLEQMTRSPTSGRRSSVGTTPMSAPVKQNRRVRAAPASAPRPATAQPAAASKPRSRSSSAGGSRKRLFSIDEEDTTEPPRKSSRGTSSGKARGGKSDRRLGKNGGEDENENACLLLSLANTISALKDEPLEDQQDYGQLAGMGGVSMQELCVRHCDEGPAATGRSGGDGSGATLGRRGRKAAKGAMIPSRTKRPMSDDEMELDGANWASSAPSGDEDTAALKVSEGVIPMSLVSRRRPEPGLRRRRRRRKPPPERSTLAGLSPIKALALTRRSLHGTTGMIVAASLDAAARAKLGEGGETSGMSSCPEERRLRLLLASPKVRRWIMYEWFYCSLDRPWFMQNEMQEYLSHLGLSGALKLSRSEWACLRSALGRPRRLSLAFLRDERAKLEAYRQAVRTRHQQIPTNEICKLAPELPLPISVGQRVTAIHPITRTINDGSVLTVDDQNFCRIQFDQQHLAVEQVHDLHLAASDPIENLPPCLARVYQMAGLKPPVGIGSIHSHAISLSQPSAAAAQRAKTSSGLIPMSLTAEAIAIVSKVASELDTKEVLLSKLRHLKLSSGAEAADAPCQDLQRYMALLKLHLTQTNAELKPMLQQLLEIHGALNSPEAAAVHGRALQLAAEEASLGLEKLLEPTREGHALQEVQAEVSGCVVGLEGLVEGADKEREGVLASRQAVLGSARALLEKTLNGELKESLSMDLSLLSPSNPEGQGLVSLLTACIAMLMQVQAVSELPSSRRQVDQCLDPLANALVPRCEANYPAFREIQASIAQLKELLAGSA